MMTDDSRAAFAQALARAKAAAPDAAMAEVFVLSLNGVAHGKRVPLSALEALAAFGPGALKFQTSLLGLDIFGADVPESGIAMEIGDPDGLLVPLPHTLAPLPFAATPTLSLQGMIADPTTGHPGAFDPRGVLMRALAEAARRGLTPVVALELEFYLIDPASAAPARHPATGEPLAARQMMDLETLRAFEPVMAAITTAARDLGASPETILSEFGAGQFEINLPHEADAALACDHLVALKRAIRLAARHHGLDATFMAKPFTGWSGSGLHIHASLVDDKGHNLFDQSGAPVGPRLGHALAGLMDVCADTFLMLAPHLNSYRRFRAGSYAPVACNWGLDNRGAALRVPATTGKGARLEHRIAGADANPYLAAAAVIAGILHGLTRKLEPPEPSTAETGPGPVFPLSWPDALAAFEESAFVKAAFGVPFAHVFAAIKRQEIAALHGRVSDVERSLYLRRF
ncbi:MAG: glutamine synthetase family protein [Acuticoccus sp.]